MAKIIGAGGVGTQPPQQPKIMLKKGGRN